MSIAQVNAASRLAAEQRLGDRPYSWEADCFGSFEHWRKIMRLRLLLDQGRMVEAILESEEYGIPLDEVWV